MKKILIFAGFILVVAAPTLVDKYYNSYDQNAVREKLSGMYPGNKKIELISKNSTMYDVWSVTDSSNKKNHYRFSHGKITKDTTVYTCACN